MDIVVYYRLTHLHIFIFAKKLMRDGNEKNNELVN